MFLKKNSILIKRYLNYIEPIEHNKKMWVVGTQKNQVHENFHLTFLNVFKEFLFIPKLAIICMKM
jgi:hypothetical protein